MNGILERAKMAQSSFLFPNNSAQANMTVYSAKLEIMTLLSLVVFYVMLGSLVIFGHLTPSAGATFILAAGFLVASGASVWWNTARIISRAPSVHGLQRTPGNAFFFFFNISASLLVVEVLGVMMWGTSIPSSALGAL
jgi:hypothetical protein